MNPTADQQVPAPTTPIAMFGLWRVGTPDRQTVALDAVAAA
ncbi:hypothetical protein [Nocardia wallacei]|nr:hypothetical protein [Nocardia wallacei]